VFTQNTTIWARWQFLTPPTGGFSTRGTDLLDANGNVFVMRGVNHPHAWFASRTNQALTDIAATGSNTVRVVLADGGQWTRTPASEVRNIINRCKELGMIAVLEIHDATGSDNNC
jgi:mannan endo-1,4-beta-mannosidase